MPPVYSKYQGRKTYKTKLIDISRELAGSLAAYGGLMGFKLRYRFKFAGTYTEMRGIFEPLKEKIKTTRFITSEEGEMGYWVENIRSLGDFAACCREATYEYYEYRTGPADRKNENAWTKCEIFYKGRWVKAHTVRECIELKGRLEFCDCE